MTREKNPEAMVRKLCTFDRALLDQIAAFVQEYRLHNPGVRFGFTDAVRVLISRGLLVKA